MAKIVVADDEAHILHVVSMKLRNAGFEVLTAADGEEALDLIREERPDAVITDNQMPYMTGIELCHELRADESLRELGVIMLTARGFDITPEETREAGIRCVLEKPFSPREVLQSVQELLGLAQESSAD